MMGMLLLGYTTDKNCDVMSCARCQDKMMGMLLLGLIQQTSIVMTCLVIDVRIR
jgi:hypothetical protein